MDDAEEKRKKKSQAFSWTTPRGDILVFWTLD
jgi:hypothetical protein